MRITGTITYPANWLPIILQEATDRAELHDDIRTLLPNEVKIVAKYVKNVLASRPKNSASIPDATGNDHEL